MAPTPLKILIADDDAGDRKQIVRALKHAQLLCDFTETQSIGEALEACRHVVYDCAVVDYRLPGQDGLEGVTALHAQQHYMAIIMATGQGDEMVATEAMKRGAADYIPKALITPHSMSRSVKNAVEKANLRRKVAQQSEELENFTRVLVHDLKEPINSVQGFASLIEDRLQAGSQDQVTEFCRRIIRASRRMSLLIDTVHQYTKAEDSVTFEPLEMERVVQDTLSNLSHLIQERRACVTHTGLPLILGNAAQLTQLLQNLIGNGIKYCEAATPQISISAERGPGGEWVFAVQDNGIGIPQKHYQEVFAPFKRLHGVGKYEGTGLGLATCKKIVERHQGTIWCESSVGQGTTFFFTLRAPE
jgi:signal transduction histidine kinase